MGDGIDDHDRLMRKLRRRQHGHDWIVSVADDGTVTIRHRRAPFRANLHGLDAETRARLAAARNDEEVDAALPPQAQEALLTGMREYLMRGAAHG